jgi:hypothetical protein
MIHYKYIHLTRWISKIYLGCDHRRYYDRSTFRGFLSLRGRVQHQPSQKVLLRGIGDLRQRNIHQTNLFRLHRRKIQVHSISWLIICLATFSLLDAAQIPRPHNSWFFTFVAITVSYPINFQKYTCITNTLVYFEGVI